MDDFDDEEVEEIVSPTSFWEYISFAIHVPQQYALILLRAQCLPVDIPDIEDDDDNFDDTNEEEQPQQFNYQYSDDEYDYESSYRDGTFRTPSPVRKTNIRVDDEGYIVPRKNTKPIYQIPPLRSGIWYTCSEIMFFRYEGLFSLWKAVVPIFVYESAEQAIAAALEDHLNESFDLFDPYIVPLHHQKPFTPNLITSVLSRSFTRFVLSPIYLVSVVMSVQTSDPLHIKFKSSWNAFKTLFFSGCASTSILQTVGNVYKRMYPTPYFTFGAHLIIEGLEACDDLLIRRYFGISPKAAPLKYGLFYFGYHLTSLLVKLPLETIEVRMIVSGKRKPKETIIGNVVVSDAEEESHCEFPSCVQLAEKKYTSPFNCLTRIVTEEAVGYARSDEETMVPTLKKKKKQRRGIKSGILGGFAQLYRGFWYYTTLAALEATLLVVSNMSVTSEGDFDYY